jgi:hypothetical protein
MLARSASSRAWRFFEQGLRHNAGARRPDVSPKGRCRMAISLDEMGAYKGALAIKLSPSIRGLGFIV